MSWRDKVNHKRRVPSKGFRCKRSSLFRVTIGLDEDTFNELRSKALKDTMSLASVIRDYIEIGLETEKMEIEDAQWKEWR